MDVKITSKERTIKLAKGQARFRVARDVKRPFSVIAGQQEVLATGTDFNIDKLPSQWTVSLLEGHVLVTSPDTSWVRLKHVPILNLIAKNHAMIELQPGDQLTSNTNGHTMLRKNIDAEKTLAWLDRKIYFDDEPLETAIVRINRYRQAPIHLADRAIGALRISGVFDTDKTDSFIEAVTTLLPLRSTWQPNGDIALSIR